MILCTCTPVFSEELHDAAYVYIEELKLFTCTQLYFRTQHKFTCSNTAVVPPEHKSSCI